MNEPTPRFTGIFIPVAVLELRERGEISILEMFLIPLMDSLKDEEGRCLESNACLAECLNVNRTLFLKPRLV